ATTPVTDGDHTHAITASKPINAVLLGVPQTSLPLARHHSGSARHFTPVAPKPAWQLSIPPPWCVINLVHYRYRRKLHDVFMRAAVVPQGPIFPGCANQAQICSRIIIKAGIGDPARQLERQEKPKQPTRRC